MRFHPLHPRGRLTTLCRSRLRTSLLTAVAGAAMILPLQADAVSAASVPDQTAATARATAGAASSDVIVRLDASGNIIRPDADRARDRAAPTTTALTFTYNSATEPWTAAEVAWLTTATATMYPIAVAILGYPAFSITVNIRKNSSLGRGGEYNQFSNEIVLPGLLPDVLAHEIAHAFRDDWVIMSALTYEEGMARAAEVEIMDRLPQYQSDYWDNHHSYYEDELYDMLDTQSVGSYAGNLFSGYNALMRYELSGYAWGKALIEKPTFLAVFNRGYFARMRAVGSVTESDLVTLAAAAKPSVEGLSFVAWYRQQGVLNTRPPIGYFLMFQSGQRVDWNATGPGAVTLMQRVSDGWEHNIANASLRWTALAADGTVLCSGTGTTNQYGWYAGLAWPQPPYDGRVTVKVTATAPDGSLISAQYLDVWGNAPGVYGVVPGVTSGTVTINKLDAPTSSTTVPLVNGAFGAPALESVRGQFLVTVTRPGSPPISRRLTKDASSYYVLLASPNLRVRLTDSPDPAAVETPVVYTAHVTNDRPQNASGVTLRLTLPAGTSVTAMDAGCAVYENVPFIDTVICRLGWLQAGGAVTVRVTYVAMAAGPMSVTATVVGNETDRATANNSSTQVTQIL